ncbi:MAG: hypothetical protein LBP61_09810 [Desulfovibrio sp.]|jgi:hypothetical protein|nr:hypothetical protein [Desulfovibrio sp.]
MIVIDGRQSELSLSNYANLEEVLSTLLTDEGLDQRIVTDVLVNDEAFSELYPHQAEDIEVGEIERLEVRTVSVEEMATDVVGELPVVVDIMAGGARSVAGSLRGGELAEAFETLQDMITVTRDFIGAVHVLRSQFSGGGSRNLDALCDTLGDLLGEITDVIANEDWILVADLLEYEYLPACEGWRGIITALAGDIAAARGE